MLKKERIKLILKSLEDVYHGAETALFYNSFFELLVAVILSAQCTDERVNIVTKRLFPTYNTPEKLGVLSQMELEGLIHDCGLYKSKAKNILKTCHILSEKFQGQVPNNIPDLLTLPGVGKKTANVMVSVAFGIPAIAVDTHVFRVSHRLGLATGKDPLSVEKELMQVIPKPKWGEAHHWLIWHGRKVCKAHKPLCGICTLIDYCPYKEKKL